MGYPLCLSSPVIIGSDISDHPSVSSLFQGPSSLLIFSPSPLFGGFFFPSQRSFTFHYMSQPILGHFFGLSLPLSVRLFSLQHKLFSGLSFGFLDTSSPLLFGPWSALFFS